LLIDQILQRYGIQIIDHFSFSVAHSSWVMQRAPLAVGAVAVFLAAALGRIERLVHGDDDVGHGDLVGAARQAVAAARAADRFDDLVAAQLAEQLLQVGQRNRLTLADAGQRDRTFAWRKARSIIAVTAKRPLVVRRITTSVGLKYRPSRSALKARLVDRISQVYQTLTKLVG
jgi:hypothetical protein